MWGIALRPRALPEDSVCRPMSQRTCMAILQFALEIPFRSVMEGCHPRNPRWRSRLFLHPHRQYTVFDDRRPLDKVCFPQRSIANQRQRAYLDLPQRPRDTVSGFAPLKDCLFTAALFACSRCRASRTARSALSTRCNAVLLYRLFCDSKAQKNRRKAWRKSPPLHAACSAAAFVFF